MKRFGCSIAQNTWTIVIAQYGQAGLTEIAIKIFKEMKEEGCQPNGNTYNYLVIFLCGNKGQNIDEAIKVFLEMVHSGYMPIK
jgi:pentatricopeptide repeat protein